MAVQNQTPVASFTTNGVTKVFPYAFMLLDADDLVVTLDGVTVSSGFTISGVGVAGGGNITFATAPATDQTLVLRRVIALQRLTDYQRNGDLLAATLNTDFDRLWQALQGLRQDSTRAIKLPDETLTDQTITDDAATRAGKLVGFDASGNAVAVSLADPDTLIVSAFIETLLAAADAATARATLGAVGLTGAETVAGVKTFSSAPKVPDGSAADEPATKGQLDVVEATAASDLADAVDPENIAPTLLVAGAPVATTSGTTVDFTSIPAWAQRITIAVSGISTNGTSDIIVQIGDSGGIENTGYLGSVISTSGTTGADLVTTGFGVDRAHAASLALHGMLELVLLDASTNLWAYRSTVARVDAGQIFTAAGSKALSAALDRVRITTLGGVNTFDAGSVNILYE